MNAWRMSQRSQPTDPRSLRAVQGNRSSNPAADMPLRCSRAHASGVARTSDMEDGTRAKHPRANGVLRHIHLTARRFNLPSDTHSAGNDVDVHSHRER